MKTKSKQVELLNEVYEVLKEMVRQEEEFHNFGSEYCEKPEYEETVLDLKQRMEAFANENGFKFN